MNFIRRRFFFLALGALLVSIAAGRAILPWFESKYRCPDCSVILVSIDTLRADHLGCYGYSRDTSPTIDLFSREAVRFSTAIAQGPSTAVSHASMLTSVIPAVHGAFVTRKTPISRAVPTMAELLKARGFATASFNGGGQVSKRYGFDRGFDIYRSFSEGDYTAEKFVDRVREATAWISQNKGKQFFIFLHTYETHHPYAPAPEFAALFRGSYSGPLPGEISWSLLRQLNGGALPFTEDDRRYIVALYDSEIRSMDHGFDELTSFLKAQGLYDKIVVILTSDHGEELGEHGLYGYHSHTLYDELLKVPLLVKFPHDSFAGRVISRQVRSIDIVPTVLDVLGLPALPHFQGVSLVEALRGADFPAKAFSQRDSRHENLPTALRTEKWKATRRHLYDLQSDPGEKKNVAEQHADIFGSMRSDIDMAIRSAPPASNKVEVDPAVLEQLRSLGYVN